MIGNRLKIIITGTFIIAITLGIFFRFYKIGHTPSGLYLDEAAIGYNAYSILKTGKDEFGMTLPLMFRSFTTFQTPIYTYLTVPVVKVFGLSIFSTRLPSVVIGILTLIIFFFFIKNITPKNLSPLMAPISTLLLAVSPWHILFSRTAYETNISLFFLILGSYLFTLSLKKPWFFIISFISFSISFLAYQAERIVIPILFIFLITNKIKEIKNNYRHYMGPVVAASIIGIVLIFPTLMIMRTPGFLSRANALNILSNPLNSSTQDQNYPSLNQISGTAKEFLSLYTSYFSPRYLFSLGDSGQRSSFPDISTFFVWQLPFLLYGFYQILKRKELGFLRNFTLVLLLTSPIPAALTRDPYTTIRSLTMVIPQVTIISLGIISLFETLKGKTRPIFFVITCLIATFSLGKLYLSIFYYNDYFRSSYWDYGWEKAVNRLNSFDPKIPIVVDNSRGEPYIHLLFFLKYDPAKYQEDNFEVNQSDYYLNMNRQKIKKIGNITVKKFQWGIDTESIEQYIVADNVTISMDQQKEHCLSLVDTIAYHDGNVGINIYKTNPILKKNGPCKN